MSNNPSDCDCDGFDRRELAYQQQQTAPDGMTYDCSRQQHQSGYAMQNLAMMDNNGYSVGAPHSAELYSNDFHNFQADPLNGPVSYYGNSNTDLMQAYEGNDGPSSSGLNMGQYFTSVDPMMMVPQSQAYGASDYTDLNNLEPSLVPEHLNTAQVPVNPQQQSQSAQVQHQQQLQRSANAGLASNQQPPRHVHQANMAAYVVANYYNNSYHSSPTGSSHTSSGTDISDEGDEMFGMSPYKRSPTCEIDYRNIKGKRQGKKRKPRKDPNEPQKPVSAYALFFRDTQAAIKGQNPNASFGEVSKIVASMWDSLGTDAKNLYKQKTELAKKEYLKQLAAYRANLLSKGSRGCMTMDSFAELAAQQRKASMQAQSASPPDSTTSSSLEQKDPCTEIGAKTLASLIAEPAPQQVLTATTTLTVPQSYTSARAKGDYLLDNECGNGNPLCIRTTSCHQKPAIDEQSHWTSDYSSVAKNCRDMYTGWIPARQQQQQPTGAFAPV